MIDLESYHNELQDIYRFIPKKKYAQVLVETDSEPSDTTEIEDESGDSESGLTKTVSSNTVQGSHNANDIARPGQNGFRLISGYVEKSI